MKMRKTRMKNANWETMLLPILLLTLFTCAKNGTEPRENAFPAFRGKEIIIDTIHPWQKWVDTLSVVDEDTALSFCISDFSTSFLLKDSIISFSPRLQDTGFYDFNVIACDPKKQCDSVRFQLTISPEFAYINEASKIIYYSEGGTIYCGQTTIYGNASVTTIEEYEYNPFGLISKVSLNDSTQAEYTFTYDSLYFPIKISRSTSGQQNAYYDSMVYDGNLNLIKSLSISNNNGNISIQDETDFEFDNQNRMISMTYSYETQSCDVNNICSTWTRHDIVQYEYNSAGLVAKKTHTYNGGQLDDSVVYTYNSELKLIEEKNYSGQWIYPTQYIYNSDGVLIGKVWYQGTGDLGGKDDYTYDPQGQLIKIDDYCGNYTTFSYQGYTQYEWIKVKAIKTPATAQMFKDDPGLSKKGNTINKNVNNLIVNLVMTELKKAGKIGIAFAFKQSRRHH
jgi:hypothetical protein